MRHPLLVIVLFSLVLPSASQAASSSYRLRDKKCKAGYVRQVRHVKHRRQVWCVRRKAPSRARRTFTSLIVTRTFLAFAPPRYLTIEAQVYAGPAELAGVPVTLTIKDSHSGQTIASFAVTSHAPCAVVVTFNQAVTERIYTGESVGLYPACPLARVSVPEVESTHITGFYGGSAAYAPSTVFESQPF